MIRPRYTLKLARTKLRSKRGMLIASTIVASLLFAALIAMVIVFDGAEKSASTFVKKAGNDRYLVKVSPNIPYDQISIPLNPSIEEIRHIRAYEQTYYQQLREKYKSLGIKYDESIEVQALEPSSFVTESTPEEQRFMTNYRSPVIQELNNQKAAEYAKNATNKLKDLKQIATNYGASGYMIAEQSSMLWPLPYTRYIENNKEDFSVSEQKGGPTPYGGYTNAIYNGTYHFTATQLLTRYLLTSDTSHLKGIPVIVSAQEAVSLFGDKLGLDKEPEPANKKLAWLREIQTKTKDVTYQSCYRNAAEQVMLDKIQRDYADMKNNENNPDYQAPSLIYDYPAEACGDIIIKQDNRSAAEKQAEANSIEQQKKLGTYEAPEHRLLTFQIVGVKYAQDFLDYTEGLEPYVKSLLTPQDTSWSLDIPLEMYQSLPEELKFDDLKQTSTTLLPQLYTDDEFASHVLEFTSVDQARTFLNKETCPTKQNDCNRKFSAAPYGSNYLILDEIGKLFNKIARIAFPVVLGLATIIIWFTISRIMAENRKETAVYRAMGATRRDVTAIYLMYVLIVALQIAVVSIVLGVLVAFAVDIYYGQILTDIAVSAFGIVDGAPTFSLFSLGSPLLPAIVISILAISLIASIQPLIRNVRRNPIRDMREE